MTTPDMPGIEAQQDNLDNRFFDKLHATLDTLGLTPEESVIVGGQVYQGYGLRPADDLDLLVGPQTYLELVRGERESNALPVDDLKYSRRPGVMSLSWIDPSTKILEHADVICRYDPGAQTSVDEAQTSFIDDMPSMSTVHSGLHFATLSNNIRHMLEHPHLDRAKAKHNSTTIITNLHRFLSGELTGDAPIPLDIRTAQEALGLLEHKWRHKFAKAVLHR